VPGRVTARTCERSPGAGDDQPTGLAEVLLARIPYDVDPESFVRQAAGVLSDDRQVRPFLLAVLPVTGALVSGQRLAAHVRRLADESQATEHMSTELHLLRRAAAC